MDPGAAPDDAQVDRLLTVMRAQKTVQAIIPQVQASQQQMLAQLTAGQTLTARHRAAHAGRRRLSG